jgi:hypothetical protein
VNHRFVNMQRPTDFSLANSRSGIPLLVSLMAALLLSACIDFGGSQAPARLAVSATAPAPATEDIARWLISCMRGRTEGGSFADAEEGRVAMDEALMNCRVFLERFDEGETASRVEGLREDARHWLSHYTQLSLRKSAQSTGGRPMSLEELFPGHSAYALDLRRQFGHRIHYRTDLARHSVASFNIDCRSRDGRLLPLSNVILAKLASMSAEHAHLEVEVDSRGEDVRVTDVLVDRDGREMHRTLAFEIDRWGELKVRNGRVQAVLNACHGGWGEIWVMPNR